MVNPNDLTSFNSLNREEVLRELKPILGEEYCDWNAGLLYTITKMANDITHFKTDNQVWYDKSQELEQQIQTNQDRIQELENEVSTHLEALKRGQVWSQSQAQEVQQKNQTIQGLENQLQDSQQRILALEADKSDLIHQLTQAKEIYQNHLTQEKFHLTQEIQLIKEVIHE